MLHAVSNARMPLGTHGRTVQAGSLANAQQLAGAFLKPRPGWLDDDRLVIRLFFQRFGTTTFIDLHKLHSTIHPRNQSIRQWCSPECDDDLSAATVYLPAPNLHNLADRNGFVTAEVKDSFQDEVGVQPGGTEGRRVAGLEGKGEQGTRIECPMVIGIARQDKAMSQGFEVLGLRLRHARRVPQKVNWSGHGAIAIKRTYHTIRQTATCWKSSDEAVLGRAVAGLGEPPRPMSGGSVNGPAFARLALVLRKRTQRFHEAHEKPPSGGGLISQRREFNESRKLRR